jgi:hypothetical protein
MRKSETIVHGNHYGESIDEEREEIVRWKSRNALAFN